MARESAAQLGGTLAEHLVLANAATDDDLTRLVANAFRLPQVNPDDLARISSEVIAVIPADMAIELRTIPVALSGNELSVAMGDPTDTHAIDELAFFTDLQIFRAVATQRQIAWCLAHYYGFVTELGQTLMAEEDEPPAARRETPTGHPRAERRVMPLSDKHEIVAEPTPGGGTQALLSGLADDAWTATPGAKGDTTAPAAPGRKARKLAPREEPVPELSPRAGEVAVKSEREATPRSEDMQLPAVVLDPALADDKAGGDEAVVILDKPKRRAARSTELGVGNASDTHAAAHDAHPHPVTREATEPNAEIVAAAPLDPGSVDVDSGYRPEDTDPYRPGGKKRADPDDPEQRPTLKLPRDKVAAALTKNADLDDGWGPPGTTIPPPFLGAMPDSYEDRGAESIPIPTLEAPRRRAPSSTPPVEQSEEDRETDAMLDVIAALEDAQTRDGVISTLCGYVADECGSAVFCAVRSGALRPFKRGGERKEAPHIPEDGSPLFAVMTERKPFCGPISGSDDQRFVAAMLGEASEIVASAIAVRGRVVGVLLGRAPENAIFLERLAVVARAGGRALERILRARKAQ